MTATLTIARRTVATGTKTLLRAGTATAKLKPANGAAARLRRMKKATGTLEVTVRSASGRRSATKVLAFKK